MFRNTRFGREIWAAKILLASMGIISTFILFKVALSTLPGLWVSLRSWLSPLYVYIIVNFIILTIAASSAFQHQTHHPSGSSLPPNTKPATATAAVQPQDKDESDGSKTTTSNNDDVWNDIIMQEHDHQEAEVKDDHDHDDVHLSAALMKDDDKESLDERWKAIMEAKGKPMKKQLKKSETWDVPPRLARANCQVDDGGDGDGDGDNDPAAWARRELSKSDTFNDRVSLRLRRDYVSDRDELKTRAEAFINKMKLQRMESEQRFMEMVNRGV